jgi:PAS domain S-box-containing protein
MLSEAQYRDLIDNAMVGVYQSSISGDVLYINDMAVRMFGYGDADEMRADGVIMRYKNADDRTVFLDELKKKGSVSNYEVQMLTRSGEEKTLLISATLKGEEITGMLMDITERRRTGEALRESEERYRNIYETAPLTFVLWDHECRVTDWNAYAEKVFGWSRDEILGHNFFEFLVPEEDRPRVEDVVSALMRGEIERDVIHECLTKSGERILCRWNNSILYDGKHNIIGAMSLGLDITREQRAEEGLLKSEERYRTLVENIDLGISLMDADHNIIMVNSSMANLFNEPVSGFIGKKCFNEFEKRCDICPHCPGGKALRSGKREEVEAVRVSADGTRVSVRIQVFPFFRDDGKPAGFIELVEDISQRKAAEEKLRTVEERLSSVIDVSPVILWAIEANGVFTLSEGRGLDALGLKPGQAVGESVFDLYKDSPEALSAIKRCMAGEEFIQDTELGGHIWQVQYTPHRNDNGVVTDISGVSIDITDRIKSENELRESRQMLQSVLDSIPVRVFWKDRDLVYLGCNQLFADDSGLKSPEEIIGKSDFELSWDVQADLYRADDHQVIESGEPRFNYEEPQVGPDGTRYVVRTSKVPLKDINGEIIGVLGTYEDITEQKRIREALDESELRFRDFFEKAAIGFHIFGPDRTIVDINESELSLLGLTRDEIVGKKNWADLIVPEQRGRFEKHWQDIKDKGEVRNLEYTLVHKDGRYINVLFNASSRFDNDGNLISTRGSVLDITYRKEAEQQLRQTVEELQRSNAELQRFAYIASHDLQEPLRTITSYVQLLRNRYQGKLDSDADEFINFVVDGSRTMRNLIEDLLTYSRLWQQGRRPMMVDCHRIVEMVKHNLASSIDESGAQISCGPMPQVMSDESRLVQVFQNLVANSIKFHSDEPLRVHIEAQRLKHAWKFSVKDNGLGINPMYADRIFEAFQRLYPRSKYSGTGIGLAVCRKIVEEYGGRIGVESEPGKGSTFYFTLPIDE